MDELGKPSTNDEQVGDFLNTVAIYKLKSVHYMLNIGLMSQIL
jgi:hypothetical protein